MNAAIRAVVRRAIGRGLEVSGIRRGYAGLLAGDMDLLTRAGVANVIQRGGTILGTSRCEDFLTAEGRARAAAVLRQGDVDGLVVIGGEGTLEGATLLAEEHGVSAAGVPGTIDNDVFGSDFTIGFDTAVNTALEAIDRIRDTAASHERVFLVEVMGRTCGDIALGVGVAGGAEDVLVPEVHLDLEMVARELHRIRELTGLEPRVCVFGHIQRGGTPTARDRILASRLGSAAVDMLLVGGGCMVGEACGRVVRVPLRESWQRRRSAPAELLALVRELA
jgi:6-phosphofructokinase 1